MFFASLIAVFLTALSALSAPSVITTVSFDEVYDNSDGSLTTVACSDGFNGLLTKGQSHALRRVDAMLNCAT